MSHNRFQNQIISDPFDMDARLAYADWLDQQADVRGTFIRSQIERLNTNPDAIGPAFFHAIDQERKLLNKYCKQWAGPIQTIAPNHRFTRGFVESVSVSLKKFLETHEDIFTAAPIRALGLRQCNKERLLELAGVKGIRQVSELRMIKCSFTGVELQTALASPNFERLNSLSLGQIKIDESISRALGESPVAPQLKALSLGQLNAVEENSVDLPAILEGAKNLQFLSYGDPLSESDVDAILALKDLRGLELYDASNENVAQLLGSGKLANLRWLALLGCEDLTPLEKANQLRLKRLHLGWHEMSNDAWISLLSAEQFLGNLMYLNAEYSRILTSACAKSLVALPLFQQLDFLELSFFKKMSKSAFTGLVKEWQERWTPGRKLCLPGISLKPWDLKQIQKEYGKDSFVNSNNYPRSYDGIAFHCTLLTPGEELFETLQIWNNGLF